MATYNILGYDSTNNLPILPASDDVSNVQGDLTVANNATITGNLTVNGTTTTVNTEITTADDYIHLNGSYTNTGAAKDAGFIFTVEPDGTVFTTTAFANGHSVALNANPSSAFSAGDIVQISGATSPENNGLYEAYLFDSQHIQFRTAGSINSALADICQPVSFTNESDTGATVVRVKVMQLKTKESSNDFVYRYGSTAANMSADQTFGGAVSLSSITAGSGNSTLTTASGDITVEVDTSQAMKFQINGTDKLVFDADKIKLKSGAELFVESEAIITTSYNFAGGSTVSVYDLIFINNAKQMSPASASSSIDAVRGHQVVGVALESGAGGATSIVGNICITPGQIMPLNFGSDLTSGDTGKAVYLSTTNGRATLTAPSATGNKVVRVGYVWDGSANIGTTGIHSVVFQPQFITEIS